MNQPNQPQNLSSNDAEQIGSTHSMREAAHALGIETSTLRKWMRSGRIQAFVGPNRRYYVTGEELRRCLDSRKEVA